LLVQLRRLFALRFELLDLIAKADALKMLPGVYQQAGCHRRTDCHSTPEIAKPRWRYGQNQPGVVDSFHCVIFRHEPHLGATRSR
jgi:hypothetical protein